MKKIIILAVVAILIAASCGLVVVNTQISNYGTQMLYQSTATTGIGTASYQGAVTPVPPSTGPVSAYLTQTTELEKSGYFCWTHNEIEQNTSLSYSGPALAVVDTATTEYYNGTVWQHVVNVGNGYINTQQLIEQPAWHW